MDLCPWLSLVFEGSWKFGGCFLESDDAAIKFLDRHSCLDIKVIFLGSVAREPQNVVRDK